MAKWHFDRPGTWDYDTLGFIATQGDILDASNAPDAFWSPADASLAETVQRFATVPVPPFVETPDGAAMVWDATGNKWLPMTTSLDNAFAQIDPTTKEVLDGNGNPVTGGSGSGGQPLIDTLREPVIIAHRGGGQLCYPEHTMVAYQAAADGGFVIDIDPWRLSDGTFACCHDSTADRTMNISGALSTLTPAQWKAARVDPLVAGFPAQIPVLLDEALDKFGGRALMHIEIKTSADAADLIAKIQERGLERSVWLSSTDLTVCQQVTDAGIGTQLIRDDVGTTGPTYDAVKAAGVSFVQPSVASVTQARIQDYAANGIRVLPWDAAQDHTSYEQWLTWGAAGAVSGDPWALTRDFVPLTAREQWDEGQVGPAALTYSPANGPIVYDMGVPSLGFGYTNTSAMIGSRALGRFGWGAPECRMRFFAQCPATAYATPSSHWIAAIYVGESTDNNAPHTGSANEQSYVFKIGHDGAMNIWYRNGSTQTTVVSAPADTVNYPTDGSAGTEYEYEIELTDTTAYLRNITLGTEISGARPADTLTTSDSFISASCRFGPAQWRDFRLVRTY